MTKYLNRPVISCSCGNNKSPRLGFCNLIFFFLPFYNSLFSPILHVHTYFLGHFPKHHHRHTFTVYYSKEILLPNFKSRETGTKFYPDGRKDVFRVTFTLVPEFMEGVRSEARERKNRLW